MAHFDDLGPGYVVVAFSKGRGELAGCFADDLEVMDHPCMNEFVFFKCSTASLYIPFNPLNGINDILQAPPIIPYRLIASFKTSLRRG